MQRHPLIDPDVDRLTGTLKECVDHSELAFETELTAGGDGSGQVVRVDVEPARRLRALVHDFTVATEADRDIRERPGGGTPESFRVEERLTFGAGLPMGSRWRVCGAPWG